MTLGTITCDSIDDMVTVVAGLVRAGLTFEVEIGKFGMWTVTLTGGF